MTRKITAATKARKRAKGEVEAVELSPEQEEMAQRVCARMEEKMLAAVRQMVRRLVGRKPEEIFGPGEFELRDGLHRIGASVMEETVNERAKSKKGVLGC
jgi:hypothetical protein